MAKPKLKAKSQSPKPKRFVYKEKEDATRKKRIANEVLTELAEKHGGVNEDIVLAEAERPDSRLHQFFDWDNDAAANKWRREQARQLIMSCKFVVMIQEPRPVVDVGPEQVEVRKLVAPFRGQGFVFRNEALADTDARKVLVLRKLNELESWTRSVFDMTELDGLRELIVPMVRDLKQTLD